MFKELFDEFGVEINAIYETNDPKTVEKEVFQEIISLMHCFAMKLYSPKKKRTVDINKKAIRVRSIRC